MVELHTLIVCGMPSCGSHYSDVAIGLVNLAEISLERDAVKLSFIGAGKREEATVKVGNELALGSVEVDGEELCVCVVENRNGIHSLRAIVIRHIVDVAGVARKLAYRLSNILLDVVTNQFHGNHLLRGKVGLRKLCIVVALSVCTGCDIMVGIAKILYQTEAGTLCEGEADESVKHIAVGQVESEHTVSGLRGAVSLLDDEGRLTIWSRSAGRWLTCVQLSETLHCRHH